MRVEGGKLKGKAFKDVLVKILSSKFFPFFTAAVVLVCYYLGWDLVTIYYLVAVGVLMLLLLDDLTPLVCQLMFLHVIISMQNSPQQSPAVEDSRSDFYMRPEVLAQIITAVAIYILAMIARIVCLGKDGTFKRTDVFFGLCAFALALVLNGLFSSGYQLNNLLYGVILAFFFLVVFVMISGNVKISEENYIRIGWAFVAFSLLLSVEVVAKYIALGSSILDDGQIIREMVVFGWGIWNTMGMLLVISIPAVMLLSSKYKHGYLFILYATVLVLMAVLTTSRQAIICAALIYPASVITSIVRSKNRIVTSILFGVVVCFAVVVVIVKWDSVSRLLTTTIENLFDEEGRFHGNGRLQLLQQSVDYFVSAPLFGRGFHIPFGADAGFVGLGDFIPLMAHNTVAELIATCGAVGLITYLVHRIQTVVAFFRKVTVNKVYIGLVLGILLIMSLVDNHIFYIFPTIIYSSLLPFAIGKATEGRAILSKRRDKQLAEAEASLLSR